MEEVPATISPPERVNFRTVAFWEPRSQQLLALKENGDTEAVTLLTKAKKFLEYDCIERDGENWICKPIKGYNNTTYHIIEMGDTLICDCQGYANKQFCSHCLAVLQFDFIKNYKGG